LEVSGAGDGEVGARKAADTRAALGMVEGRDYVAGKDGN